MHTCAKARNSGCEAGEPGPIRVVLTAPDATAARSPAWSNRPSADGTSSAAHPPIPGPPAPGPRPDKEAARPTPVHTPASRWTTPDANHPQPDLQALLVAAAQEACRGPPPCRRTSRHSPAAPTSAGAGASRDSAPTTARVHAAPADAAPPVSAPTPPRRLLPPPRSPAPSQPSRLDLTPVRADLLPGLNLKITVVMARTAEGFLPEGASLPRPPSGGASATAPESAPAGAS